MAENKDGNIPTLPEGKPKSLRGFVKEHPQPIIINNYFIEIKMPGHSDDYSVKAISVNIILGIILLGFLMFVVFYSPANLNEEQARIIRFVAATAGGLVSAFFLGRLNLGGRLPYFNDLQIAAAGGAAIFIFVYLFWRQ